MFLFHMVPEGFKGPKLYPLSQLRMMHPEAYERHLQKYELTGRTQHARLRIPRFDCFWSEVVFLCPVFPGEIRAALKRAGFKRPALNEYFVIDPFMLDPACTAVWIGRDNPENPIEYVPYDVNTLSRFEHLPHGARVAYQEFWRQGKEPLLFAGVPHILYRGTIDVSKAQRIVA